jgi:hypothetical protein
MVKGVMGRPRGAPLPASELADVGEGMVRVFLRVPPPLAEGMGKPRQRPVHLAIAVERLLLTEPRPRIPEVMAEGPGAQWTVLRWQAERMEERFGLADRDRAFLLAIERYISEIDQ